MFVAIRYMEEEAHAIADIVGPFTTYDRAYGFLRKHWSDLDQDLTEIYEVQLPQDYEG